MKLINKLLPLATIGCVAAVVTPLATSCGSSMFDGYNLWIPKSAKAVWDHENFPDGYTENKALNLYLTDVKNNPNVFIDDILLRLSISFIEERAWDEKNNHKFECKANIKYENIVADPTNSTMSYKVSGSGYMTEEGVLSINLKNFSFDVKNIPYILKWGYTEKWYLRCDSNFTTSDSASINTTIDGNFFSDGSFCDFNHDSFVFDKNHAYEALTRSQQLAIELMFDLLGRTDSDIGTYHMQDIPLVGTSQNNKR